MRKDIERKLIARYAIREAMGLVVMGVALFWSAGRIDWWPGASQHLLMFGLPQCRQRIWFVIMV
jgi:hypothetical protein